VNDKYHDIRDSDKGSISRLRLSKKENTWINNTHRVLLINEKICIYLFLYKIFVEYFEILMKGNILAKKMNTY